MTFLAVSAFLCGTRPRVSTNHSRPEETDHQRLQSGRQMRSFPSLTTSHCAIKSSSVLATFGYSLMAEIPACPYLQINKQ